MEIHSDLHYLELLVVDSIGTGADLTPFKIRSLVDELASRFQLKVSDQEKDTLARMLETRYDVTMELGFALQDESYTPWLANARPSMDNYYWKRYKDYLAESAKLSPMVVGALDTVTDRILDLTENPLKEGKWDRRGMVMGHVQSGKTGNYIGLICKAADAGYGFFIVIAGTQNQLRNQTQLRVDEGFVGRDSSKYLAKKEDVYVGVGRKGDRRIPISLTNYSRDFNKATAQTVFSLLSAKVPVIVVVKKNASTLSNLHDWLQAFSSSGLDRTVKESLFLIDDEADNASINVKYGGGEVTRINMEIRRLLKLFDRSTYVGYTATPFANIFIDPDLVDEKLGEDLFPRSFIVSLDPPSNYYGAQRIFLEDDLNCLRVVDDNEDVLPVKLNSHFEVAAIPESLEQAVRTFVVARAIRILRGQGSSHSSMMVNASTFVNIQNQVAVHIRTLLEAIQGAARLHFAMPEVSALRNPEIGALHDVWMAEYQHLGHAWSDIQPKLNEAAGQIQTRVVNTKSRETLNYRDYREGMHVIVVGGSALSRGLTLEGLTVSYLLRNTKMYDTLMQFGRWFGYRPEYGDLVRIWMTESTLAAYRHVAASIEELREELMAMEIAGATPKEFGLKVRAHEDSLLITARNKMGASQEVELQASLEKQLRETVVLDAKARVLAENLRAVRTFADLLSQTSRSVSSAQWTPPQGWLIPDVPVEPVLEFLRLFRNHPSSLRSDPDAIRGYIQDRMDEELAHWDVLFASTSKAEMQDSSLGVTIYCQRRTPADDPKKNGSIVFRNSKVGSRGTERAGLSQAQIASAEQEYRANAKDGKENTPDTVYRLHRTKPLLMIHLLDISTGDVRYFEEPVVAWGISFPATRLKNKPALFRVNQTFLRQMSFWDDSGDDDEGDTDED